MRGLGGTKNDSGTERGPVYRPTRTLRFPAVIILSSLKGAVDNQRHCADGSRSVRLPRERWALSGSQPAIRVQR